MNACVLGASKCTGSSRDRATLRRVLLEEVKEDWRTFKARMRGHWQMIRLSDTDRRVLKEKRTELRARIENEVVPRARVGDAVRVIIRDKPELAGHTGVVFRIREQSRHGGYVRGTRVAAGAAALTCDALSHAGHGAHGQYRRCGDAAGQLGRWLFLHEEAIIGCSSEAEHAMAADPEDTRKYRADRTAERNCSHQNSPTAVRSADTTRIQVFHGPARSAKAFGAPHYSLGAHARPCSKGPCGHARGQRGVGLPRVCV